MLAVLRMVEQPQTLAVELGKRAGNVLRGLALVDAKPLGGRDVGLHLARNANLEGAMVRLDWNTHRVDRRCLDSWQAEEAVDAPVHLLLERNKDAAQPRTLRYALRACLTKRGDRRR